MKLRRLKLRTMSKMGWPIVFVFTNDGLARSFAEFRSGDRITITGRRNHGGKSVTQSRLGA